MVKEVLADRQLQAELRRGKVRSACMRDLQDACGGCPRLDPGPKTEGGSPLPDQVVGGQVPSWRLSVINSINCVRILLQAAYWWYAALQLKQRLVSLSHAYHSSQRHARQ